MVKCSRCQEFFEKEVCVLYSRDKQKTREYFYCRPCNAERARRYRATKVGGLNIRKAVRKSIRKHYEKQLARLKLNYQVKVGNIKRPKNCSVCLEEKDVQGHHEDYAKPFQVIWVCRQCHADLDRKQRCES